MNAVLGLKRLVCDVAGQRRTLKAELVRDVAGQSWPLKVELCPHCGRERVQDGGNKRRLSVYRPPDEGADEGGRKQAYRSGRDSAMGPGWKKETEYKRRPATLGMGS